MWFGRRSAPPAVLRCRVSAPRQRRRWKRTTTDSGRVGTAPPGERLADEKERLKRGTREATENDEEDGNRKRDLKYGNGGFQKYQICQIFWDGNIKGSDIAGW